MTTTPKITTTESTDSRHKRRRRPYHTRARVTDAGEYMVCGHFISKNRIIDVNTYTGDIEFFPCPGCEYIRRLEKDMKGHWPVFKIPASLALDIVDIAQPKDTAA